MSSYLALAGVTATLQHLLNNAFFSASATLPSQPTVSCLAPDQVKIAAGGAAQDENQVNLFLHQVTHNAAWRNADLPALGANGKARLGNPPLALDLHYLLTVYGSNFWQAEALLGCAALALHQTPTLTRADIEAALQYWQTRATSGFWDIVTGLADCGLADQIEMIKITPSPLGREEMAWLWTALKADYRPTYPFQVTVALIQPQREVSAGPPVLQRAASVNVILPARIARLSPGGDAGAAPGDTIVATGEFLAGVTHVVLTSSKFGRFAIPVGEAANTSFSFALNSAPPPPAGVYSLVGQMRDASGAVRQSTAALPIALAPSLATQQAVVTVTPDAVLVGVASIDPPVSERQQVSLALSTVGALASASDYFSVCAPLAKPISGSATSCVFAFPPTLPLAAKLLARLVVDGVASKVAVDWSQHPPAFVAPMVTT